MKPTNPFLEIYGSEKYSRPYNYNLQNFPMILDIEATNYCNLDCLMCSRQIMKRKTGKMSLALFKKIADEAAKEGAKGLRFIRFGEPLLNEKIFEMVKYAKQKGLLTHITTNGLLLDKKKISKIFESSLDSIIFSFQGTNKEEYERIRNNKKYDLLEQTIKTLIAERKRLGAKKPFVQVTTTLLDETQAQTSGFYSKWEKIADRVDHWFTSLERLSNIERARLLKSRQAVKQKLKEWEEGTGRKWRCNEVMTKMSINWDGTVTACCADYDNLMKIGDTTETPLIEIWNSEKMGFFRKILAKGERKKINFCSKCTSKF